MKEWKGISEEAKDIVNRCLNKNPKRRIKPADVLEHKWFKEQFEIKLD